MNECTVCLQYQIQHNLIKAEKCPECGKYSFSWKQNEDGCFYTECGDCGFFMVADLNTPCEMNGYFYQDIKLEIIPQTKEVSAKMILKLAKLFHISALQMKNGIKEGYTADVSPYIIEELLKLLSESDIAYKVDSLFEPRKVYESYKECRYPYSRMNQLKRDDLREET